MTDFDFDFSSMSDLKPKMQLKPEPIDLFKKYS